MDPEAIIFIGAGTIPVPTEGHDMDESRDPAADETPARTFLRTFGINLVPIVGIRLEMEELAAESDGRGAVIYTTMRDGSESLCFVPQDNIDLPAEPDARLAIVKAVSQYNPDSELVIINVDQADVEEEKGFAFDCDIHTYGELMLNPDGDPAITTINTAAKVIQSILYEHGVESIEESIEIVQIVLDAFRAECHAQGQQPHAA